jgi:hypothetical protein
LPLALATKTDKHTPHAPASPGLPSVTKSRKSNHHRLDHPVLSNFKRKT